MKKNDLGKTVKEHAQNIRGIIQGCSTESVVRNCLVRSMIDNLPFHELYSPARQMNFLLALLLESKEPADAQEFGVSQWKEIVGHLQAAFSAYSWSHLTENESPTSQSRQEIDDLVTVRLAFIDYFQKTTLAFEEQFAKRIKLYLAPYDDYLSSKLGVNASASLTIARWIVESSQKRLDEVYSEYGDEELDLLRWATGEPNSSRLNSLEGRRPTSRVLAQLKDLGKVRRSELIRRYGKEGEEFWKLFTVGRGEGMGIDYPTEQSIVARNPLIRLSEDVAMLFRLETLFEAILLQGEECVLEGPLQKNYLRDRDRTLEKQAESALMRILGDKAQVYRNVYETAKRQHEHDLVILSNDICLFVEAKASPPVEPFRDPKRAIVRLRHHFNSNKGIQKSYDQSLRLLKSTRESGGLTLYNHAGGIAVDLPSETAARAFCVCVTRDSYGPLASFLSLMLKKESDDPYPWAVNVLDLENIAVAWEYFGWDGRQLKSYLSQRLPLHDRAVSDDELDFVGAFIQHCGLRRLFQSLFRLIVIPSWYSDIFDRIHFYRLRGEPKVTMGPTNPLFQETSKSVGVLGMDLTRRSMRVGRNERCPCESGVKFKSCHGAK